MASLFGRNQAQTTTVPTPTPRPPDEATGHNTGTGHNRRKTATRAKRSKTIATGAFRGGLKSDENEKTFHLD